MSFILLTTKLNIPPIRPKLVHRHRLISKLNEGLYRKLTLISAPAGFGKSTLVRDWVDNLQIDSATEKTPEIKIAWLSLDEGDNDPVRFLSYFFGALEQTGVLDDSVGKEALSMLQSPQPPLTEAVFTPLINNIALLPIKIFFIMDDFHVITAQAVQDALIYLLEYLPPQMHVVIASREDPPFSLASLRAKDQVTELRARDLRFNSSEIEEFFKLVVDLDLSEVDISALEKRTEGWITSLQLAAISMQGRKDQADFIKSFTDSHLYILDYLIEEVLNKQSEDVQNFLLQTAILDRLTGSLCDTLTKQQDGEATLEMLEAANLFTISLDENRQWYRYHHLFANLLRQRLRLTQPQQVSLLNQKASDWFKQNQYENEAIEYAMRGKDFERAARWIEDAIEPSWMRREDTQLRRWLDELPVELVYSKPKLCIYQARHLYLTGHMKEAEERLQAAELALGCSTNQLRKKTTKKDKKPDADTIRLLGRIAAVRADLVSARGDLKKLIQYAQQALEFLPETDLSWRYSAILSIGDVYNFTGDVPSAYQTRMDALVLSKKSGNPYMVLFASGNIVITLRDMGRLQQAQEICQQQVEIAKEIGLSQTVSVGYLYMLWGEILAEINELDRALELAVNGEELLERGKDVVLLSRSYLSFLKVLFSRGDLSHAEEILQKMIKVNLEHDVPTWITNHIKAWQARIWLEQDKLGLASQWAGEIDSDVEGELKPLHEYAYGILARILIAQDRLEEAARLLERLFKTAEAGEYTSRMIEILILQGLAYQASKNKTQALVKLEKALSLAEPGGFIRVFVDEGPPMARLLNKALNSGIAPEFVQHLLAAFPGKEPDKAGSMKPQVDQFEWIEPLSEREIEVLQLINQGLTNQEIATRLFLSIYTVKTHTRNIYGKLDVHNRTHAIAKAKKLGILELI